MKIRPIVIAIVSLFTVSIAHAQYLWSNLPPGMGPYFRAGLGPAFFQDSNLKGWSFGGPTSKVSYGTGISGQLAVGFAFNRYVGLDFQTGYTWARMSSVQNYDANGSTMGNVPFLANLTMSLPVHHNKIIPFLGAGFGAAASVFDAHIFTEPGGVSISGNEDTAVFAWQAFAGVRFMVNQNVSLGVGYDFFMTGNPTFTYPASPSPNLNVEFEGVRTHSILFTLQANF